MFIAVAVYIFILGLCFGSFALAMVDRMRAKKDWVKGRSECDYCHHKLGAMDLIPVLSWVVAHGSCRYCKKKLSYAYPLAEVLTGLAFLGSFLFFPYELNGYGTVLLILWLFGLILCTALVLFDLRWYLLPSKLVYPLVGIAFVHKIVFMAGSSESMSSLLLNTGLGLVVGSGFFYVLHMISNGKWIGDGDVRLGLAIGLFVEGPVQAWLVIFTASLLGILIALPKVKKTKNAMKMKLPYGPLLIAGLYLTYLFGNELIDWYGKTFLYL